MGYGLCLGLRLWSAVWLSRRVNGLDIGLGLGLGCGLGLRVLFWA